MNVNEVAETVFATKRLLIVEDDPLQNEILCMHFEGEFEVFSACDGPSAVNLAKKFKPHLILLDSHVPGLTAEQLCHKFNLDLTLGPPKIILMTGQECISRPEMKQTWITQHHVADVLFKPFEIGNLKAIINTFFPPGPPPCENHPCAPE